MTNSVEGDGLFHQGSHPGIPEGISATNSTLNDAESGSQTELPEVLASVEKRNASPDSETQTAASMTDSSRISSMDIEHSIPTVAEITGRTELADFSEPPRRRESCCFGLSLVLLVLFGAAIGILAVYLSNQERAPTPEDLTRDPSARQNQVFRYLSEHNISPISQVETLKTPQNKAARWMALQDPGMLPVPNESPASSEGFKFMQRYIMAFMYYSMDGENWKYNVNFLSDKDTCDWFSWIVLPSSTSPMGVQCNKSGHIAALVFVGSELKFKLPSELAKLTTIQAMELDVNQISGKIPMEFHKLTKLEHFHVSHNDLSGELPSFFGDYDYMQTVDVSFNSMSGTIPPEIAEVDTLRGLALDNNQFEGNIMFWSRTHESKLGQENMQYLFVEKNLLTGALEESMLRAMPNLRVLDASDNRLHGSIPEFLFRLEKLSILDLHDNDFTGEMPHLISANNELSLLALHKNRLQGKLPNTLSYLTKLEHLDVSDNQLTGVEERDASGGGLSMLKELTYLFLAANNFHQGEIFPWIRQLTNLKELSLKGLKRTGTIPSWLGDLKDLVLLDLDDNDLSGALPPFLGQLSKLQFLLLNRNNLIGSIPTDLADANQLRVLYVDGNNLEGSLNMMCKRPVGSRTPIMVADCGGSWPEVICECCAKCCSSNEPCNDDTLVPSNDPLWQFGYDRTFYSFGNLTGFFFAFP